MKINKNLLNFSESLPIIVDEKNNSNGIHYIYNQQRSAIIFNIIKKLENNT